MTNGRAGRSRVLAQTSRHFKNKHTTQKLVIYFVLFLGKDAPEFARNNHKL